MRIINTSEETFNGECSTTQWRSGVVAGVATSRLWGPMSHDEILNRLYTRQEPEDVTLNNPNIQLFMLGFKMKYSLNC